MPNIKYSQAQRDQVKHLFWYGKKPSSKRGSGIYQKGVFTIKIITEMTGVKSGSVFSIAKGIG